jgi:hypothetical protein
MLQSGKLEHESMNKAASYALKTQNASHYATKKIHLPDYSQN